MLDFNCDGAACAGNSAEGWHLSLRARCMSLNPKAGYVYMYDEAEMKGKGKRDNG